MGLFIAVGLLVVVGTGLVLFVKSSVQDVTRTHRLRRGKIVALAATAGGLVVLPYLVGDIDDVRRVQDLRHDLETRSAQVLPLGSDPWKAADLAPASAEQEAEADALQADLEAAGYQVIRSDSLDLRTLEPNPRGFLLPSDQLKQLGAEPGASADEADKNWPPWSRPRPREDPAARPVSTGMASFLR